MKIYKVTDPEFKPYGRIVTGYEKETAAIVKALEEKTPCPEEGHSYVAEDPNIQNLPEARALAPSLFGGLPCEFGWCNGRNTKLNNLEYHRNSEFNLSTEDIILFLAKKDEIVDGKLDSSKVKAFRLPAGVLVEVYATTLHYTACQTSKNKGFRNLVVLPKGTNVGTVKTDGKDPEDALLFQTNKWLIAHPDSPKAAQGAYVGITGDNIDLADELD